MDKKGKIIFALSLLVIVLLICFSIVITREVATLRNQIDAYASVKPDKIDTKQLAEEVSQHIILPIPKNGADGLDGFNGNNGINGKDSVSTHNNTVIEKEVIVKEQVPLMGEKGERGADIKIQLNPITNDLEVKYSDSNFWEVIVPCGKMIISCLKAEL